MSQDKQDRCREPRSDPPSAQPATPAAPAAPSVLDGCCGAAHADHDHGGGKKRDWLLLVSGALVALGYLTHLFVPVSALSPALAAFAHGVFEFMNVMWWGLLLGIFFVGLLERVPRAFVTGLLGRGEGVGGIARATAAGLLLDLCSHGILLVGLKLYERGASLGQTMAFLIASPWNSLSLTIILFALIGVKWTLVFILLSAVLAIVSGLIFDGLVARGVLPANPHRAAHEPGAADFRFWPEFRGLFRGAKVNIQEFRGILRDGLRDSGMIIRWMLVGVVLAALIRVLLSPEAFQDWFGPTLLGLAATLVATTIIEVCSEGSSPIAADLLNRAGAPGNAFTFLMAGAATDYTEVMGLKERTKSWRIALFLPLVTVPQVIAIAIVLNQF